MSDTPILKQAQDKLRPFEHRLLDTFSKVFQRKRPPTSLRSLQPLAMVFLLEAFGLAFLLDRETARLAVLAARGPGKGDDDDLLDDSDEMAAIRWAAARQEAVDRAYMAVAKERHKNSCSGLSIIQWIKAGFGPDRVQFEKQWGEHNPIDPATAPKCFDPSAQLSILDAVGHGDGYLGVFVSTMFLASSAPKQVTCINQTLDLEGCETLEMAAWRAVSNGWIAYLDHRGVVMGLRLIPRTDGIQTRLRAPLVNIVSMFQEDKRDEQIAQLQEKLKAITAERDDLHNMLSSSNLCDKEIKDRDQQWQDATGASDPEMASELTAQRIEQIQSLTAERDVAIDATKNEVLKLRAGIEERIERSDEKESLEKAQAVGRMLWPDPDNAPTQIACANAIVAHRRGEFVELEFPASPRIFENIQAWLMFHQFGLRAPTPDATGYCTCAIGASGEVPPAWNAMKQGKRDSYPGFVLFGPNNTGKVVFCAKTTAKKAAKRSTKNVDKRSAKKVKP